MVSEQNFLEEVGAKIKVVGVGGGGSNMVEHMIKNNKNSTIRTMIANTDIQSLNSSNSKEKIQLGLKTTRGLGCGMIPEIGNKSAEESREQLIDSLKDNDIVFIATGLGGGTGTGAAPIVAQVAKEVGALTIAVVTKPFKFEGKKRERLAKDGLEELVKHTDSIIVIPNEKLYSIIDSNVGIKDAFKIVDEVLARAVKGITDVIQMHGTSDINLDFADVRTIMNYKGHALMGIGEAKGENAAFNAIEKAISSPLLDDVEIDGAMGVLVNFYINPNYPLLEISRAMEIIYSNVDEDANVMFGTTTNEDMGIDEVKITLIATGFNEEKKELLKPINKPIEYIRENSQKQNETRTFKESNIKPQIDSKIFDIRKKMFSINNNFEIDNLEEPTYLRLS